MQLTPKIETIPANSVRGFKIEDAPRVFEIIQACLSDVNSKDYPAEVIEYMKKYLSIEKIISNSQDKLTLIAQDGEMITGTLTIKDNEISEVFVDPKFHNSGIGKRLMQKAEDVIRGGGFKSIFLKSSITAVGFYKKIGFEVVEEHEDANFGKTVVMTKKLSAQD